MTPLRRTCQPFRGHLTCRQAFRQAGRLGEGAALCAFLALLLAACSATRPAANSRSVDARPAIRTVAIAVDAGDQGRVPAAHVMSALRMVLLFHGYRPVLLPTLADPLAGARGYGADALLRVGLALRWRSVAVRRGRPSYVDVEDIPDVRVTTRLIDLATGRTVLRDRSTARAST